LKRIREIIVVEGRCDVSAVKRAVEATVVETSGFRIFGQGQLALISALGRALPPGAYDQDGGAVNGTF
jgi:5S rRNA maturation endonuclease (ribonuclease M5)